MRKIVPALAIGVLFASCATLQVSQDQGNARLVADLINTGQAEKLAEMCSSPFLLDQEVVPLPADVASFWQGIVDAGFKVTVPEAGEGQALTSDTYKEFADTFEAKLFFTKYMDKGARLLELSAADGRRVLLVMADIWLDKKIFGFKGPF